MWKGKSHVKIIKNKGRCAKKNCLFKNKHKKHNVSTVHGLLQVWHTENCKLGLAGNSWTGRDVLPSSAEWKMSSCASSAFYTLPSAV